MHSRGSRNLAEDFRDHGVCRVDRQEAPFANEYTGALQIFCVFLDGLIYAFKEQQQFIQSPSDVICLVPAKSIMETISGLCLDAFVPGVFEENLQMVRELNGAGYRLDAEFKLAPRIVSYVMCVMHTANCKQPFHSAVLSPAVVFEAYIFQVWCHRRHMKRERPM